MGYANRDRVYKWKQSVQMVTESSLPWAGQPHSEGYIQLWASQWTWEAVANPGSLENGDLVSERNWKQDSEAVMMETETTGLEMKAGGEGEEVSLMAVLSVNSGQGQSQSE